MFWRKIFRRTASIAFIAVILLFAAIGIAEIKLYTVTGEDFPNNRENLEVARQRAIENAVKKATKEAGVYIKAYSRTIDSELTDDEVEVITSKTYQIVGTPKFTQDIINYSGDTQIIVLKATVEVKVDDSEVRKYIERDYKEKSILIEQTRQSNKASEENSRKIEDLREKYKLATSQTERDRIIKQMEQADREFLANQKLEEGNKLYYAKDYQGAIKLYNEAIKLNSNNYQAYNNRGLAYQGLKQYEQAISDHNTAIELNPNNSVMYYNRGLAYQGLNKYEQAISDYNMEIKINPNDSGAYNNRGVAYSDLKQYERAIQDYNKAIELNPNADKAYYNRGGAYYYLNQYDLAISDYNKAIQLNPNYSWAYNALGNAYYMLKNYKQAIENYTKMIELNSSYAEVYYWRGICYQQLGEEAKAQADFAKAKELGYNC